jgi:hypothetical protein
MAKPKDYEEALAQLETAKENLAAEREGLREFKKENKIRRNKPVEDAKVAKELEAKESKMEAARQKMEDAKTAAKELKPRKERVTKYEYPADCVTDKDKKKYRAKMRREAKKETAGEGEAKATPKKKTPIKKPAAGQED